MELKAAKGKVFFFRCVLDSERNRPDKKRGKGVRFRKGEFKRGKPKDKGERLAFEGFFYFPLVFGFPPLV